MVTLKIRNSDLALFRNVVSKLEQIPMTIIDCMEFDLLMEKVSVMIGLVERKKLEITSKYAESTDDGNFIINGNNDILFKDVETRDRCMLEFNRFQQEYSEIEIAAKFSISGKTMMLPAETRIIKNVIEII